jgi:hypothetical protein
MAQEAQCYRGITEIREVRSASEVNELLSLGYELLKICEVGSLDPVTKESKSSIIYVLGQNKPQKIQEERERTQDSNTISSPYVLRFDVDGKPVTVSEDESPFQSFFVGRILKGMKSKYPSFDWKFIKNTNGQIYEAHFFGELSESQRKEIGTTLDWTLKRIVENRAKKSKER